MERREVAALAPLVDAGRVKVYREEAPLEERARLHGLYEHWILNEVVPRIQSDSSTDELIATGVSFHAANFALRHAHLFPLAICQSGVYDSPHDWPARRAQIAHHLPRFL